MRLRVPFWLAAIAIGSLVCSVAWAEADDAPPPVPAAETLDETPGEPDEAEKEEDEEGETEDAPDESASGIRGDIPGILDELEPQGQDAPGEAIAEEQPVSPGEWAPPLPSATDYDWLQMKSGEWLKGEFKTLRDYRVFFESDEFDELDLDWKKVSSFYLPRPHSFRVQGRVLFGTAELRGSVLRVRTKDAVFEFDRSELSDIAQGGDRELDWWSFALGLSLSAREGNTQQVDFSGRGRISRESAVTRFVTDYRGVFGKVDGDKTANNHRVQMDFDIFLTRRLYWTVPFAEWYQDEFQNIATRFTPGTALGYEFVRNSWLELESSVGAAYQFGQLESGVDEKRTSHDFAVVSTAKVNFDFPDGSDFDNEYRLQLVATDLGKTSHHGESVLSVDVWGPLDLDVTFIWDRIEEPADSDDDPKKNDFRLMVGFEIDF